MPPDPLEAEIDAAIAQCGGDMRLTIAALLEQMKAKQRKLDLAAGAMSHGFSRGWFASRKKVSEDAVDAGS